jgi:hypothetical protein
MPSIGPATGYYQIKDSHPEYRYVGLAVLNGGNFTDSYTKRYVLSHYNRRLTPLFSCPNYLDNNAQTTYTFTVSGTNFTTLASLDMIYDGLNVVHLSAQVYATVIVAGFAAITDFYDTASVASSVIAATPCTLNYAGGGQAKFSPAILTATLKVKATGNPTIAADFARNGLTTDPFATFLQAAAWM